jgi:hypothetical protein
MIVDGMMLVASSATRVRVFALDGADAPFVAKGAVHVGYGIVL